MIKLATAILGGFVFLIVTPLTAFAQSNTYNCIENADGVCEVDLGGPYCNPGYEADESVCSNTPITLCNSKVNNACQPVEAPPDDGPLMCTCMSGVCTPTYNPELQQVTCEACNSPTANAYCTAVNVYRCVSLQQGCALCQRLPDGSYPEGCTLSSGDCQRDCKADTTAERVQCDNKPGTVDTAIGCVPFDIISQTARFFLAWSLSVGGGVALLLVGISGFVFATSAGNPQKLNSAKELFWAAISGLAMLLLSVFLLRAIGVDLLGIFS